MATSQITRNADNTEQKWNRHGSVADEKMEPKIFWNGQGKEQTEKAGRGGWGRVGGWEVALS